MSTTQSQRRYSAQKDCPEPTARDYRVPVLSVLSKTAQDRLPRTTGHLKRRLQEKEGEGYSKLYPLRLAL